MSEFVAPGSSERALPLRIFDDEPAEAKGKAYLLGALLVLVNVAVWLWAYVSFREHPLLLGTASLAYTLGLRHAVDPDHIAAIDNVTRKLMQDGRRPVTVGLFFALGHSTVVIAASLLVALSVGMLEARFEGFRAFGGVIGTGVSAAFLLVIALVNTVILISVYRAFQAVRRGNDVTEHELHDLLQQRGFLARMLRSLFAVITKSWQMYPLGLLFGLGFDTASEIGLLGISAAQGSAGLPVWAILVFPALFTAGMSLIDTADGIMMVQAYGWAFAQPVRKLYYNLTMTLISIIVALLIGGIEALGLIASKLELQGPFWDFIGKVSDDFGLLGYLIVGVFIAAWLISMLVFRLGRFDEAGGERRAR
ncbi:HoxN/HupN/NixA family nickel/cobalt transporter [Bradyrhizobium genosp. P]|uniref:HoxN/HupN/NixA family nickel/cobalt transporter n=1 Tax=Bradyrhizobium genosp. P TaxID=83641 RepID=UPI003CEAA875